MTTNVETTGRDAVLVQDAAQIQMMGLPVLEALPTRGVPYQRVDPFLLVHESRLRLSELSGLDTKHPHRGFDNLWYILEGSASTGHSTGPDGAIERARLPKGALLALRTGRGAWLNQAAPACFEEVENAARHGFGPDCHRVRRLRLYRSSCRACADQAWLPRSRCRQTP